jgi:hypothetical protein
MLASFLSILLVGGFVIFTNISVLVAGAIGLYYASKPLTEIISTFPNDSEWIGTALLFANGMALFILVWKMEGSAREFDQCMNFVSREVVKKNARIQELEAELKKWRLEEGRESSCYA